MRSPLDDIEFLTRSRNRVAVLDELIGGPRERDQLLEETGISRVTLARILRDLEKRRWVTKVGPRRYEATALGRLVAEDLSHLCRTMRTVERLRPIERWLPMELIDFDLRLLEDAEVVLPDAGDPLAPARRAVEEMRSARRVRLLAEAVTSETLRVQHESAADGALRSEIVLDGETYDTIVESEMMREQFADLLGSGRTSAFRSERSVPVTLAVYDDELVGFGLIDETAVPSAAVLSRDETVLAWAERTIDAYEADATPIRAGDLPV